MAENFTEKEKRIVEQNIIDAEHSLSSKIYNINTGLNLMGLYAEINPKNKNQLDFYTLDGSYIASKIMGYTRDYVSDSLGNYPYAKFIYFDQVYSFDTFKVDGFSDRYIFRTYSTTGSGKGYTIEMFFNKLDMLKQMEIRSYRSEDDCIIKEFEIKDSAIKANVENAFGPSGNYEDGEERQIWFDSEDPLLFMTEAVWPKHGENHRQISSASFEVGKISSNNYLYENISDDRMREIMLNITRHPRNKELINYVLNEYEKMIPGIREFISNSFSIYNSVINQEYVSDGITDTMIGDTIMERCNFENIKGAKSRNLTQNKKKN